MIKRTLYFGNPAYLRCRNDQLEIEIPGAKMLSEKDRTTTIPVEDIGVVILDDSQISITHHLIHKLLENNVALITCDDKHMPLGLMLNLNGNSVQQERFEAQIEASVPLKKQIWSQIVESKITNQAAVLKSQKSPFENMLYWASKVKSGDPDNFEARAAAHYWQHIFPELENFRRNPEGPEPNSMLNYGYAVLRAVAARSLVGSGLLPTLGVFHRNRYNAYCLSDDIMEPYRPYVDLTVIRILGKNKEAGFLLKETKSELLMIPAMDVSIDGQKSPLMIAMQQTTASLAKCFLAEVRKVIFPELL